MSFQISDAEPSGRHVQAILPGTSCVEMNQCIRFRAALPISVLPKGTSLQMNGTYVHSFTTVCCAGDRR